MDKTYDLHFRGKTYDGISLAEAKDILGQVYSRAYIQDLVNKANRDHSPSTIDWVPGRNMNWIINGVRMGHKAAVFALEWKGHTKEEALCVLRANKLCTETDELIKTIRAEREHLDEELRRLPKRLRNGTRS